MKSTMILRALRRFRAEGSTITVGVAVLEYRFNAMYSAQRSMGAISRLRSCHMGKTRMKSTVGRM